MKIQKGGSLGMLLVILGASVLGNKFIRKGVLRAGKDIVRVRTGWNNIDHMNKKI